MADLIRDPENRFRRDYNRINFMFPHQLADHPLFELPSLVALSRRMPDHRDTYWSNGPVAVDNPWEAGTAERLSVQDTITGIETNNSIVILKHTEQDPVYAPLLQGVLASLVALSGERMRSDVTVGEILILISSPNRITPYHMDGEANFLLQVRGDKTFYVFDHTDRSLVTELELENYYAGVQSAATYRAERQGDGRAYDLKAGFGVHVPVTAPHWVQNRNNVSVALSCTYELRSIDRLIQLHRFNRRLRKLGLHPTPPGVSEWRDRAKLAAAGGIEALRAWRRPAAAPRPYPAWTPSGQP